MSWLKNQFNKFFKMDHEEQYDDEHDVDYYNEQQIKPQKQEAYEQPKSLQQDQHTKTQSFRFPLIDDEVFEEPKQRTVQEPTTTRYYEEEKETLTLPDYLQKPVQNTSYDGEVSGIRDLLERRRKGRGHSNVIRSQDDVPRKVVVTKEEREILTKNPTREERKINQEFVNPMENRKRFVPTEVPSPVHGFRKPTPIEQLMGKQQEQVNEEVAVTVEVVEQLDEPTVPLVAVQDENQLQQPVSLSVDKEAQVELVQETTEKTEQAMNVLNETQIIEPINIEKPTVQHEELLVPLETEPLLFETQENEVIREIITDPARYENVEAPSILADVEEIKTEAEVEVTVEPKQTAEEILSDVQVKHVTIENSTIHINQMNVEQMPQTEQTIIEEQPTPSLPLQSENRGSRLPFNVVMLKSDKEKLLTKQFVNEQQQQIEPIEPEAALEPSVVAEPIDVMVTSPPPIETIEESSNAIVINPTEPSSFVQNVDPTAEQMVQIMPQSVAVGTLEREEEQVDIVKVNEEVEEVEVIEEIPQLVEVNESESASEPIIEQEQEPIVLEETQLIEPVQQAKPVEQEKERIPYVKPPLEYLVPPEEMVEDRDWMDEQGDNLVESLSHFQIQAQIESIVQGPAVTQFEITVGHGTKVSKVRNLADDIKLALAAKDIRIDAPIPGKRSIGIEIPNRISRSVRLSEVTDSDSFRLSDSPLEAALGLDLTGKPVTIDLRKMPHGLIAGATGSGKSVCINSILVSLLYKANPNELKLMLIDPKMVELAPFNHIPHLVSPVITDVKAATAALKWAVEEMERRYQLFMHSGARKIEAYNKMCDQNGMYAQKLPYLLIVIDELADLMMMSPQDVEDSIVRITQKARAAGIHLIVATQRPSVDVITGLIKSNIPTRIAFSVSSQIDSRTILDSQGAERLLGKGDMLYLGNGMSAPTRIQGTFVTDDEIEEIIEYVREQGEPEYIFKQEELLKRTEAVEEQDELFEEVCRFVYEQGSASTSLLQRRYHIGYNRAARLIDMLEKQGFVSEPKGSKPRDVFITEEDLSIQFGD